MFVPRTSPHWRARPRARLGFALGTALWLVLANGSTADAASGDPTSEGTALYQRGAYEAALLEASANRTANPFIESWWRLEVESLLILGRYERAYEQLEEALRRFPYSTRLRLLAREAALYAQRPGEAETHLRRIQELLSLGIRYLRDAESLTALGEAALLLGAEPRLILENLLKPASQSTPPSRDAFLAMGQLALDKNDFALASRTFQEGLEVFPRDADLWHGLAASFLNGERARLLEYAERALRTNPNHPPTRLLLAEHRIDAEDYEGAAKELERVLQINPRHPEALALLAVIAQLKNDQAEAERLRAKALSTWKGNPAVDHLYGKKLSQKYRFAEGAAAQRKALEFDAGFTPARLQLAQDLLRLGREAEAWPEAVRAQKEDAYDVAAYNLTALRERLAGFETLTTPHFRVRMEPQEARLYGDRVLDLLDRARQAMAERYGLEIDQTVTVEIYPNPSDFAVRTFGMPNNSGFLGVCFGLVITANSPASETANWESVLWHEFAHAVTLTLSRNRMPRWLSEGISVYEEQQANPGWGMRLNLADAGRILRGEVQTLGQMSAAFLQARDPAAVRFAYLQSSLAVQFLSERHGRDKLKGILLALREGSEINQALESQAGPMAELENQFFHFARDLARRSVGGSPEESDDRVLARIEKLQSQLQSAQQSIAAQDWENARQGLSELADSGLYLPGPEGLHTLLARVRSGLQDEAGEREAWLAVARHEADSLPAVRRLLALAEAREDWPAAAEWGGAWLAINPLTPSPWRSLLTAHEKLGQPAAAVEAGRKLLALDPPDRARVHYRIARQLKGADTEAARRHVLLALEEAPRFHEAYRLLAEISRGDSYLHKTEALP